MVRADDQLGPATSASGGLAATGKQKHAATATRKQSLPPGWLSHSNVAVFNDGRAQPSSSPKLEGPLRKGRVHAVAARPSPEPATYSYDASTSTICFVDRHGAEQLCTIDQLIQQLGKQQIWAALDAISIQKATRAGPATITKANDPSGCTFLTKEDVDQPSRTAKADYEQVSCSTVPDAQPQAVQAAKRPLKRKLRHEEVSEGSESTAVAGEESLDSDDDDGAMEELPRYRSVLVGDDGAVRGYFNDACEGMQQLATKWILKQWIKAVEPNKQSTCPYSENARRNVKLKGGDGAALASAQAMRPSWWPPEEQMRHKEPDHLKKSERMLLFWALISACDADKAWQYLDDDKEHYQPWTDLLEASTKDRKNLRTPKEKANFDKPENRRKFAYRSRILDGVYTLLRAWEDLRNGSINGDTRIACIEPLPKVARAKKSASGERAVRDNSVASDATVAEDHEHLMPHYSTCFSKPESTRDAIADSSLPSAHTSFSGSSRDPSPNRHPQAVPAMTPSTRAIISASQSFSSHYGAAMQDHPAVHRHSMAPQQRPPEAQRLAAKGLCEVHDVPRDDPFELSGLQDPLTVEQPSHHAAVMEWSHSQRPRYEVPTSCMLQDPHAGPCPYEPVEVHPHSEFEQQQPMGPAYVASDIWQQPIMPQAGFPSPYDEMSGERQHLDVGSHPPPDDFYFAPVTLSGPHGVNVPTHSALPSRRPEEGYFQHQWVPQQGAIIPNHRPGRMRR